MAPKKSHPPPQLSRGPVWRQFTDAGSRRWIDTAGSGDRIGYHRGFLSTPVGLVHLIQERLGGGCFSYVAVACPWRIPTGSG